jgi:hypothetical protein
VRLDSARIPGLFTHTSIFIIKKTEERLARFAPLKRTAWTPRRLGIAGGDFRENKKVSGDDAIARARAVRR